MKPFFELGFRLSVRAAAWVFTATFVVFRVSQPTGEALLLAFYATVVVGVVVYWQAGRLLRRRFERITGELTDIAERRFDDPDENYRRKDELDDLVIEARDTARTVENELQRLTRLEHYRKEFIGDISHELKTPIFAVQGYIETLLDGALEDPAVNKRFLERAMGNVNRLTELTQDLLEISRIESGDIQSRIESVRLRETVAQVIDSLQLKAQQEGIRIILQEFDAGIRVMADRNQLKQVLVNLIENAIKYNVPEGHVLVGVKTWPKNPAKLQVFVKDTGMGIESQYLTRVTERFFRTEKSRAREQGGSGLGLAIVKHIIEAHHEHLLIESVVGKGSTFSFTLQNADRVPI
jgi:two-component system, OmpR family, phosphate regulon sensor histidine kinase PhoR